MPRSSFGGRGICMSSRRGNQHVQPEQQPIHTEELTTSEHSQVPQDTLAPQSLLDAVVARGASAADRDDADSSRLQDFLQSKSTAARLRAWLGSLPQSVQDLAACRRHLSRDIATIDQLLSKQVNAVIHHPAYQQLESSWRGLHYLWKNARDLAVEYGMEEESARFDLRVLDVRKKELQRDFEDAVDFDQNVLFKRVYEEEFGTAGGEPYGMLIADYEFSNHPDDIELMSHLSGVGASAFAPVIAAASPKLMGLDDFNSLEQPLDLESLYEQPRYRKWKSLRSRPDSQFLGLTVPRILMREPYQDDGGRHHGFRFREDVDAEDSADYLWGTAAWGFGAVVMRAFASVSWFADIRGAERGSIGGGMVTDLPSHSFQTDSEGVALRSSVDVMISDEREAELCDQGFIPLSHCKDTPYSVFYSNQSVHRPVVYDDQVATANARVSAMLQYILCASRIAHYLKTRIRDKIGGMASPGEIEYEMQEWLMQYVTPDDKASASLKAKYPLRSAEVDVAEIPGEPGKYMMTLHLLPHYQLDQLTSTLSLIARRIELNK